jgi:hypothetical protein
MHRPPGPGETAELTTPGIVDEQLSWPEHLPAARGQPRRHPGAAAQVSPPRRPRIGSRWRPDLGHLNAKPAREEKRSVPSRQRGALDPAGPRQPCRVRPSRSGHPAHRASPRIDRSRSHPRQPSQALEGCRTRTQLTAHRSAVPVRVDHLIIARALVVLVVFVAVVVFIASPDFCCPSVTCMAWRTGPRPRLHPDDHRALPTTRMTSWRAGSR